MVSGELRLRPPSLRRLCMRVRWMLWTPRAHPSWPPRRWAVLVAAVITVVAVAAGVDWLGAGPDVDPRVRAMAERVLAELEAIPVSATRAHRDDYERSAFGSAWTDAVTVAGGRNGCDTRNDVLTRDLDEVRAGPVADCPRGVLAGELRSPYTGEFVVFRRDRAASAVQIDHIVPLAYAWDMGAWSWPPDKRQDFANDPANLVAVDGESNQAKSDTEPARWMPPERGFWCQYAIQFVTVAAAYGVMLDAASAETLGEALRDTG
ncbi:HNH endonuclease family protein [Gordonia sp. 'Campus']|uniref:HNH endonuclease family protein n=1 Tax=Gordonia sp. 'Campus' TaxID=2915824 RepID=UPI001EE4BBCC|nr:HNH endonuclease family protein [Gordonia sp. 'Campus']